MIVVIVDSAGQFILMNYHEYIRGLILVSSEFKTDSVLMSLTNSCRAGYLGLRTNHEF